MQTSRHGVHRAYGSATLANAHGFLGGQAALPGFTCPLADVFEPAMPFHRVGVPRGRH